MTELERLVERAFGLHGSLWRHRPGLQHRQGQADMAAAVARAIASREHLVVEAGTGVGKTFAYLVPLLLSGRRAVLSTATQALQDQLFERDIPAVSGALGLPVRVAVLKGRASYVCLHRVEQARQGHMLARRDPALVAALSQVLAWALQSPRGDLAELPGLDERSPLRPLIRSTSQNCLGSACPHWTRCHVQRARSEALAAHWVVVNHHLLLTDLTDLTDLEPARRPDEPALLPAVDVVVIDEAHHLPDTACQLLGRSIGSAELQELAWDLGALGPLRARGQQPWAHLVLSLEQAVRALGQLLLQAPAGRSRLGWAAGAPRGLDRSAWSAVANAMSDALTLVQRALATTADAAPELAHLHGQVALMGTMWAGLTAAAGQPGEVRWLAWGGSRADAPVWRLAGAPADPSAWLGSRVSAPDGGARSWLFTSATLASDGSLAWFTARTGLDAVAAVHTLRVPSPFDHMAQAALYIPACLPDPSEPGHTPALAQAVARWASRLGGRTLVLTTTLRATRRMADHLRALVDQGACASLDILDPGRLGKRALLARFRAAGTGRAAVLVASMGFWEGVDLPGDVLQLLVIDKLPFPPPDDPLVEARSRASEAAGRPAFEAVSLPDCAQALQQGAGRLIRSATDRGVLVIADPRLLTRSYAGRLLGVLPPMRRLLDEDEMAGALDSLLTRPSTTDLSNAGSPG